MRPEEVREAEKLLATLGEIQSTIFNRKSDQLLKIVYTANTWNTHTLTEEVCGVVLRALYDHAVDRLTYLGVDLSEGLKK